MVQRQFTVNSCSPSKNLSAPSVVFAEATWYGSLRGGLHSGSGSDAQFFDGGSRWGIKGSAEASEGLTAVYRFEHKISTTDGGQPGGRLAYAGLSGGFGTITVGQIWNAAYNHVGVITDKSYYFGDSTTGYRHGNALSYAFASGPVSFQMDLISDGGMKTGQGIDKTEFGVTVAMGEIGKVAVAHTTVRDKMVTNMTDRIPGTPYKPAVINREAVPAVEAVPAGPTTYRVNTGTTAEPMYEPVKPIMVYLTAAQHADTGTPNVDADGALTAAGILLIERTGDRYHATGALAGECETLAENTDSADDCVPVPAYVQTTEETAIRRAAGAPTDQATTTTTTVTETFHAKAEAVPGDSAVPGRDAVPADVTPAVPGVPEKAPIEFTEIHPGHKNTHVAVEFNVGGVTPYVGYSVKKTNMGMKLQDKNKDKTLTEDEFLEVPATETKTTHYGVSGGLGDTGISFLVAARSEKPAGGEKSSPWLFNVSKNLGGGATVIFEHANDDDAKKTKKSRIGLHVSF